MWGELKPVVSGARVIVHLTHMALVYVGIQSSPFTLTMVASCRFVRSHGLKRPNAKQRKQQKEADIE
jgi:hypothetical protein